MCKRIWGVIWGGLLAFLVVSTAPAALAEPYGQGSYNKCEYSCPVTSAAIRTTVTLPSGLVVVINVTNGQTIPHDGYAVVVQPAEGQTGTLQRADFYINGKLIHTGTPNETGAVRWLWQPEQKTGTVNLRIVITATDNTTITREFAVTIGETLAAPTNPAPDEPDNVVDAVTRGVLNFVGSLPTPVIYALPYFLLALLAVNIILLLMQTQREIREVSTLQRIIHLERDVGIEKNAFVSLASHYLRTPLSIIEAGLDLLRTQSVLPPAISEQSQRLTESLRIKIDSLLARSDAASQVAGAPIDIEKLPSAWKNPGLYIPIFLIGLVVLVFNYIVANVESLSINQITIFVQLVAYSLLALVCYQAFRRLQLHRRDSRGMQQALAHEQAVNQTRDELIVESTTLLGGELNGLRKITSTLPQGAEPTRFIQDGITRFGGVLSKFAIASHLKGGQSIEHPVHTQLSDLLAHLPAQLDTAAAKKGVRVQLLQNATFDIREPRLVSYVLASLIDNAIEYSSTDNSVEISGNTASNMATITVTDYGAGISPQKIAMLFRPFSQTQDVERFTHEGMGFSLYLDKLILTYLGGSIQIDSKPNQKTIVTIQLPNLS